MKASKKPNTKIVTDKIQPQTPTRKRVRLSPEVRRQQILDAALVEFSALGFAGATTARIARRAGTTQSNIYVHFADKEEIFETLLRQVLVPNKGLWAPIEEGRNASEVIDTFLNDAYERMTATSIATIRLLITEGHRVPDLIRRWFNEAVEPVRAEQHRRIEQYVAAGKMKPSPLSKDFSFITSPLVHAAVMTMIFPEDIARNAITQIRETHRQSLHLLLGTDGGLKE
ncbi:TetR/AcrR family transcriptional regulator [Pectobacterium actinidiae]|uniref:TetR/AcrR family transcriptional regulator n=1 Tax=Pectobacterium actinidiae TaxID=1507808 RepID=A0ABW8G603_9GAMM